MNKTLSLIEEENEEELFTNNDEDRHSNSAFNQFGETIRQMPLNTEDYEDFSKINLDSQEDVNLYPMHNARH